MSKLIFAKWVKIKFICDNDPLSDSSLRFIESELKLTKTFNAESQFDVWQNMAFSVWKVSSDLPINQEGAQLPV